MSQWFPHMFTNQKKNRAKKNSANSGNMVDGGWYNCRTVFQILLCVCVRLPNNLSAVDAVHHPLAPLVPNFNGWRPRFAQVHKFIHHHTRHTGLTTQWPLLPAGNTQTHTDTHHCQLLLLRVKLLGFGTSVQNRHRMINKSHMADAHWRMKFGLVSMDLQTS